MGGMCVCVGGGGQDAAAERFWRREQAERCRDANPPGRGMVAEARFRDLNGAMQVPPSRPLDHGPSVSSHGPSHGRITVRELSRPELARATLPGTAPP